jgi:hypothetical protein
MDQVKKIQSGMPQVHVCKKNLFAHPHLKLEVVGIFIQSRDLSFTWRRRYFTMIERYRED